MNVYELPPRTVTHKPGEAALSFKQLPLTKIDCLLERELAGRPISFQEIDCTPALAASPFHIVHSYPSLWIVTQLGVSKNDHVLENIKLEKGPALRLFDIDLSLHTFGYTSPTLFCTINHFICNELGFMIAKADTHLFSKASNYHILTPPPSFTIAIPK